MLCMTQNINRSIVEFKEYNDADMPIIDDNINRTIVEFKEHSTKFC